MLRARLLTAVVLLLVLAVAAALSPRLLSAVGAVFLALALAEWLRLSGLPPRSAAALAALAGLGALALMLAGIDASRQLLLAWCAAASCGWLSIGGVLLGAHHRGVRLPRSFLVAVALLFGGGAWLALRALLQVGAVWTLSLLALVWLADSAAYFAGRAWGGRKLAPRISPGKTWAGVWGGAAAVLIAAECWRWLWPQLPLWSTHLLQLAPGPGVLLLLLLVAVSIIGDLFESFVKRQAGVKDSGALLPGHGGVWDRIDASLPVLPLAVLGQWMLTGG